MIFGNRCLRRGVREGGKRGGRGVGISGVYYAGERYECMLVSRISSIISDVSSQRKSEWALVSHMSLF